MNSEDQLTSAIHWAPEWKEEDFWATAVCGMEVTYWRITKIAPTCTDCLRRFEELNGKPRLSTDNQGETK